MVNNTGSGFPDTLESMRNCFYKMPVSEFLDGYVTAISEDLSGFEETGVLYGGN